MFMKGGYQILDLRAITLTKGEETSITDENILSQLLKLTDFLNKDGVADKQLKPIYIITKDSAGFVSITNTEENKLNINGFINGLSLNIDIEYISDLDDYENTVYYIDSASYTYAEAGGGTKLYQHIIWDADELNRVTIISNSPTPMTLTTSGFLTIGENGMISIIFSNDVDGIQYNLYQFGFSIDEISYYPFGEEEKIVSATFVNHLEDEVIPL